jgi:hypothetical protein
MFGWQSNQQNLYEQNPNNQKTTPKTNKQLKHESRQPKKQKINHIQLDIYLSCQNVWLAITSIKSFGKPQTSPKDNQQQTTKDSRKPTTIKQTHDST